MSDLNYLYKAQDDILLYEISEKRVQIMYEKFMYNPRKINSASELSGCIQKEQSKVILAVPTNNSTLKSFEKNNSWRFQLCKYTSIHKF